MLRFQSIPALLILATYLGGTAEAQLFRRDDPAADKAKQQQQQQKQQAQQQQQQRSQNDPRQKASAPANKAPGGSGNANSNLNNQSNRAGQLNRNNSTAQPNKAATQKNGSPQNAAANGRYQAAPQARTTGPQSASQQSAAQKLSQQGLRGVTPPTNAQQLPAANAPAANGRPAPQVNAFAPPPVAQPGFAANSNSQSMTMPQSGLDADGTIQVGDASNGSIQQGLESNGASALSESEIVDRFGLVLNPNGEDIIVARVKPQGSAATAGLRVEDKVTSIGGAPVSSRAEFYEIARLLSLGDQIEIEFERAGKTEKSFIQFGTSAAPNTMVETADAKPSDAIRVGSDSGWTPTTDDRTARLEQQVIAQQRIIQELQERIRQLQAEKAKQF